MNKLKQKQQKKNPTECLYVAKFVLSYNYTLRTNHREQPIISMWIIRIMQIARIWHLNMRIVISFRQKILTRCECLYIIRVLKICNDFKTPY